MFRGTSRAKITVGIIVVAAAAASTGYLLSQGGGPAPTHSRPPAAAPTRSAATATPTASPFGTGRGVTTVATVLRTTPRYARPGRSATGTVPASWYDRRSVLPVIGIKPGWVHVRLAQRPDGSTAWLPASAVKLGSTPYRIVVNRTTTHLALYKRGKLVFSAPAGVGAADDPTPRGEYFVAFDEQPPQPNPGYGAFIMVTSAHSTSIGDWEGSGDAIIGIHGPLGMDAAIGTGGARISHGCIRLHEQALSGLSKVPPGTPIDVIG